MKPRTILFLSYVTVLVSSHVWQTFRAEEREFWSVSGDATEAESIAVYFPGLSDSESEIEAKRKALAVDGVSQVWVANVRVSERSPDVLAKAVRDRFDGRVRLVGRGYGGVDALLLAEALGDRVFSVELETPVVSTRFELLGDERLNRAMKAFQLAWFWILENGVPHFGYSEALPYNYRFAERVFEADQNRASELYPTLPMPVELKYSQDSSFVTNGAAEAYASVRPSLTFEKAKESGRFEDFPGVQLSDWWAGLLLAVATFASEDFACIGGGLLAASGSVSLPAAVVGCFVGIFIGDLGIYFIGRVFGATALELPILRSLVSAKALGRSATWFEERGVALVVLTRFFPGSRVPTYFAAGVVKVSWIRFGLALLLASAIWTPILVLASFYLGESFLAFFESLGAGSWLGIVAFIVCFAIGVRIVAKLVTSKGRRLLYSTWRRATSWEFWPMWAVYAPVIFHITWLAIRYRSISLPFSVNPCMPASGLVFESKIQILSHLEKSGVPIARFEAIKLGLSSEEKRAKLQGFMKRLELDFPVVLKPDVGQRGQGVVIATSEEDAIAFFENQVEDTIVQEYIGGSEYGVFYQRYYNREHGVVSSITDKRTTWVVGDGRSTLEELILRDARAVCMAKYFLSEYESQLETVPGAGVKFTLASIGTHSRGAVFLDGEALITPELSAEVDRFSRVIEGFHFGRYDLRVPSEERLKLGEGIRVIELNGITSEPTNMYDPKHGPIFGWSALMRQWSEIFALAKENRLAGHEPVSKKYLVRLAWGHFRGLASKDLL